MTPSPITEIRKKLNESRQSTWLLISQLDEQAASFRSLPDAWSVKDHVAHLVAVEQSVINFSHRILKEDCPISSLCHDTAFDQDAWNKREIARRSGYTWLRIMQLLHETRQELLALLDRISEEALNRVGSHPVWGSPVTLASVLRVPYRHERAHRDEIAALRASLRLWT